MKNQRNCQGKLLLCQGNVMELSGNFKCGNPETNVHYILSIFHCQYVKIRWLFCLNLSFQLTIDLQYYLCEVLKSLMRSERNQQVMCEAGLPHELLTRCNLTLAHEIHVLHPPIQYMFERLSAQYLTPKDLRYEKKPFSFSE